MTTETVSVRARQTRSLMRPMLDAVAWRPILAGGALAVAIVAVLRGTESYNAVSTVRSGALLLCLGAAFLLDDAASQLTAPAPAPLIFRRLLRVLLGALLVGAIWAAVAAYAFAGRSPALPARRLVLELAVMLALTLALGAAGTSFLADTRGSLAAGPGLLAVAVVATRLPPRWSVLVSPADARWDAAGRDLALVLCASVATLLFFSFDPARRRVRTTLLGGRTAAARARSTRSAG